MKISYNWLKDFVDIDVGPEELTPSLITAGLEVDAIVPRAVPEGIVVGKVLSAEKHPNADKLTVCSVDAGSGEPLAVVCGAPNVRAGLVAPLATVGTRFDGDFVIKKAKLRGVESNGMLCSERELGISDDHEGLMELDDTYEVGAPLSRYFPDDYTIELEITPDRGDCFSAKGVAREVAVITGKPLRSPAQTPTESGGDVNDCLSVDIEDPQRCPRYMGRMVTGVTVGPSPAWLKNRLAACGIRSISNVVDVTNYVLMQFGQPMHAFDYARIDGRKIVVRRAAEGQTFTTLDDTERTLVDTDLLICDGSGPVALAGVMGGANSEITADTTDVFLECAYFQPAGIRRTSKRLGLKTESSTRFERGVDPEDGLVEALETAAAMIAELAGGTVVTGVIDNCPRPPSHRKVTLRPERVARVLGVAVSPQQSRAYLEGLGLPCVTDSDDGMTFDIPPRRHDIEQEVDLIEEIGRLYGYDNIPSRTAAEVSLTNEVPELERRGDAVRSALAYFGLNELLTITMASEKMRSVLTPGTDPVSILNPISPDLAQMRTCLLGSHLLVLAHNLNRRNQNNRFFEIGPVYVDRPEETLPEERLVLGVLLEGNWMAPAWNAPAIPVDFYALKGVIEHAAQLAGLGDVSFGALEADGSWFDGEAAAVQTTRGVRGVAGKLSAQVLKAFDIKSSVYYAEFDVESVLQSKPALHQYRELPRFPAIERDLAFVMPEDLPSDTVVSEIRSSSPLVESSSVFDVYRGEGLGEGRKSIAYSLRLRSPDRTLTDTEADTVCDTIVSTLSKKYGLELR